MKVYIVKYALTQGIEEREGEIIDNEKNIIKMIDSNYSEIYFNKDWAISKEDAIRLAEEKRTKKIKSLEKQLDKLKNIKFEL